MMRNKEKGTTYTTECFTENQLIYISKLFVDLSIKNGVSKLHSQLDKGSSSITMDPLHHIYHSHRHYPQNIIIPGEPCP